MGRAARRSAVLAAFFRSINGPLDDGAVFGLDFGALSETAMPLSVSRSQLVAKPYLLRRLLAPLVIARGSQRDWNAEFRELVLAACRDLGREGGPAKQGAGAGGRRAPTSDFETALGQLRRWALKRFATAPEEASAQGVRAALQTLDPEKLLEVSPSYVRDTNGIFTVSRRANVKAPLRAVREVLNPINWATLGEFFEYVGQVGNPKERKDGWRGLFEERFVIGWGPLSLNTYTVFLNVDFTYDETRVRADYSLAYEEDDQLEVDDGYLEARTIPGRPGWCAYYAEKSTRFRSPWSNLMAPVINAVSLESNLASIEDAAYDRLEFLNAGTER
jgi:hypothetical protein